MCEVSVILPCYGVEEYLPECIESILAQDFGDFELIAIDDGSPDRCGQIIDEYAAKDARIRAVHTKNQGLSLARNVGLDMARGEYIVFVDSDDFVDANLLSTVIPLAREGYGCVVYGYRYYPPTKVVTDYPVEHVTVYDPKTSDEVFDFVLYDLLQAKFKWQAWNRVFRRDVIEEHGLRFIDNSEVYAEDYLFCAMYSAHAPHTYCIPDLLYSYRRVATSLSRTRPKDPRIKQWSRLTHHALEHYKSHLDCAAFVRREEEFYLKIMGSRLRRVSAYQMAHGASIGATRRFLEDNVYDYDCFKASIFGALERGMDHQKLFGNKKASKAHIVAHYAKALWSPSHAQRLASSAVVYAAEVLVFIREFVTHQNGDKLS